MSISKPISSIFSFTLISNPQKWYIIRETIFQNNSTPLHSSIICFVVSGIWQISQVVSGITFHLQRFHLEGKILCKSLKLNCLILLYFNSWNLNKRTGCQLNSGGSDKVSCQKFYLFLCKKTEYRYFVFILDTSILSPDEICMHWTSCELLTLLSVTRIFCIQLGKPLLTV